MKPIIKHRIRGVSRSGRLEDSGARSMDILDTEISQPYLEGYELKWVYPLDMAPDLYQMLYIYVLKGADAAAEEWQAEIDKIKAEADAPEKRGPGRPKKEE